MLKVDLFGPLHACTERVHVGARDFQGAKPKQLLEILVASHGHGVSKERLADLLWGNEPPLNYLATLETYISVLRQTLEPGVRARDSLVATERGGYRVDSVELDLDAFDAHLQAAAGTEPKAALLALDSALALVRGIVLEDEPYADWAEELRSTYLPRHVQALISAGQLSLLTGDAASALARAEQAVALNPLAEAAYQVQMTAAYAMWRQDEALQAFDRCRRLLGDELGVDPLDKTVALHLSIMRHEDLASMLPRVSPENGPNIRALEPAPIASPTTLLAREQELADIHKAIERARAGAFTFILVTGETGVGKTSLAQAVAESAKMAVGSSRCSDLEQDLPYLALSLALRSLSDAPADGLPVLDELLARAEQQLPFDDLARVRAMEGLATALRGRTPFLLVLDDVQWADAETLRTLGFLHRRCPDAAITVLVTCDRSALSRTALRALPVDLRIDLDVLPASALHDDDLHTITGGNPMFVAGWRAARARGLREPFPPELRERILMCCWDLGPKAYRLLSVACALEQPFAPTLLADLVGITATAVAEELDRLVELRLLDAAEQGFAFRSPAVRSILSDTLSLARTVLLKQQAAALLAGPRRRATDPTPDGPRPVLLRRGTDHILPPQERLVALP
ncbi:MAG: Transcriptional regulator, putative ATPase, winged helix family [Frankiales bacterium]|nr:Transcriptional regulator, putative ATPase, winged helix family [Frankiales bacterium]